MRLRRALFIGAAFTAGMLQAIEPAAQQFVSMPDSLIPTIEVNRRKDLIDLFHAGQKAQATTRLGGMAQLIQLQGNDLTIAFSTQSQMSMHLYPADDGDTLVALVNTVYAPAGDSRIRFFNSKWQELPASRYMQAPTKESFFSFPDSLTQAQRKEIMRPVDIELVEYAFEADGSICARQSWEKYLDRATYDRLKPYLLEAITLRWNGKNFKNQNNKNI